MMSIRDQFLHHKKYVTNTILRPRRTPCLIKHQPTKTYGGVELQLQAFLTSAPDRD
jgi:hypothetical protein